MHEVISVHRLARILGNWETGSGKRSELLAGAMRRLVETGQLPAGSRLPSERAIASAFGIARVTAGEALDQLRDAGILSSRSGVGTFVSSMGATISAGGEARLQSFLQQDSAERIDLRSAALAAVPMVAEEIARLDLSQYGDLLQGHGYVPRGLTTLIAAICDYYRSMGLPTDPAQVLVTAGAQQAVHLVAGCVLVPGDTVIIEDPSYRGGIESLRSVGAKLVGVPSGASGVDLMALEAAFRRHRPRMALLMSTVHNPTGSSLDMAARETIGDLADKYHVLVIDDASTCDTLIDPVIPAPLGSFSENIITVGSASKSFWGGLRIGWIRASSPILGSLISAKGAEDLGTSIPAQLITSRLLPRIAEARAFRRNSLAQALERVESLMALHLSEFSFETPKGGASLWVKLPQGVSASAFCSLARRFGVDVLAGPTFSSNHGLDDHLRLAFAPDPALVEAGMARLGAVWNNNRSSLLSCKETA